jgi:hypothetical protein
MDLTNPKSDNLKAKDNEDDDDNEEIPEWLDDMDINVMKIISTPV